MTELLDDFKKALTIKESAVAYAGLGQAYFFTGNYYESLNNLTRSLELSRIGGVCLARSNQVIMNDDAGFVDYTEAVQS
jgi:tetratricopeptide (TPR) repeat protein